MSRLRLDRLLANLGYGTRREVQAMVAGGQVVLEGQVVVDASLHVAVDSTLPHRLGIAGQPCDPPTPLTVLLHKPLGVTCSHKEVGALVYDLLPLRWQQRKPVLASIGRLDKDTSGLLLLTDDGALQHRIIAPKSHIPKRYQVTLARPLAGDEAALFQSGTMRLAGETTPLAPAILEVFTPHTASLTLYEGRYHQVRRMFAAIGNHVEALHRDQIGGLTLPADLGAGEYRVLATLAAVLSKKG